MCIHATNRLVKQQISKVCRMVLDVSFNWSSNDISPADIILEMIDKFTVTAQGISRLKVQQSKVDFYD